jgi:DNA-binding FadR family transcriptional regulator
LNIGQQGDTRREDLVASETQTRASGLIRPPAGRPARLATGVVDELVALIVSGKFAEGTLLPTESSLSESFGVSRIVIREALRFLEQKGLVRVRHGQGSTVLPADEWDLIDGTVLAAAVLHDDSDVILEEIIAIRTVLESQLAAEAALRRDDDALETMRQALSHMDPTDSERFLESDRQFHSAVVRASGNIVGAAMVRDIMREAVMVQTYIGSINDAQRELSLTGHTRIFEAIEAQDARAAGEAMKSHIYESWVLRSGHEPATMPAKVPFAAIASEVNSSLG